MTRVPTIHINLEPDVKSKYKLIEQFWECLNTRLDLGQDGNYVSTSSNTTKSLTVKEGDILEEEPHFFLYLPVSRANDDFDQSLKRFTEQVSKIDNHVYLIILIKSGHISHMEFFDRGFGAMKKIYLKGSCILDEGDTKTTFNELADILKRKYNFKARNVRSLQKSCKDADGLKTLTDGRHEDQVKTEQACQEEVVTEDPAQNQRNRHGNPVKSGTLSITLRKRGIWRRFCNWFWSLNNREVEDAKRLMKKDNYKFQRQFEETFRIVPGALKSIVKAMFTKYKCEFVQNRMLTSDELENLRRKLNKYGLETDAFEELMFKVHKFREEGRKEKNATDSPRETSSLLGIEYSF